MRAEVATPQLLSRDKMGARPGADPTRFLNPDKVRTWPFRPCHDVDFLPTSPVDDLPYADYDELQHLPLNVPLAYKLKGYRPEELRDFIGYMPPLLDQPLESGALEEAGGVHPTAALPEAHEGIPYEVEGLEIPAGVRASAFDAVDVGAKWARTLDMVVRPPLRAWGRDADAPIQPTLVAHYSSAERENGASSGVRATVRVPLVATEWLPRHQDWVLGAAELAVPLGGCSKDDDFELRWVRSHFAVCHSAVCQCAIEIAVELITVDFS